VRGLSRHTLTWLAQSPDLNIIENAWFQLKKELHNDTNNINSVAELKDVIPSDLGKIARGIHKIAL